LALAVVFGLGVLAAQVRADLFLPLVMGGSAQVTPTPTPSGTVKVVNLHHHVWGSTTGDIKAYIFGELWNDTAHTVDVQRVTLRLLDTSGEPISGRRYPRKVFRSIPPGEKAPFECSFSVSTPVAFVSVVCSDIEWWPSVALEVEKHELLEWGDCWVATGQVRNQLPVTVTSRNVAILYDSAG